MMKNITLFFILFCFSESLISQNIFYVKTANDATAWNGKEPVYTDIQTAINAAATHVTNKNAEVWVAKGEYKLSQPLDPQNGVDVIGGFTGNENNVSERSFAGKGENLTILSGEKKIQVINQKEQLASPAIWKNLVICNGAGSIDGGGVVLNTNMTLSGCIIRNNEAAITGGGAYLKGNSCLLNCLVTGNVLLNNNSVKGGGVYCEGTSRIINCSIVKNSTKSNTVYGEGIFATGSSFVGNSVVWGNITYYAYSGTVQIYLEDQAQASYCAATNGCESGDNIIELDGSNEGGYMAEGPLFIDPESDWNLQAASPCVDAGNDALFVSDENLDLNGNHRKDGTIDIGAFEQFNVGISDLTNFTSSIQIYPNPCSDVLHISFDQETSYNIQIINAAGVITLEKTITGNSSSINISDLQKGCYFLLWKTGEKTGNIPLLLK